MCGIWAFLSASESIDPERLANLKESFMKIQHRGPDNSSLTEITDKLVFGFHRLAIIDPSSQSDQPLHIENDLSLICNGEIYNYRGLIEMCKYKPKTGSDCESVLPLYSKYGISGVVQRLDAEFSFVLYDRTTDQLHIARDRFGVRPLFWGRGLDGSLYISSEAKGIPETVYVEPFPRGHFATISLKQSLNSTNIFPSVSSYLSWSDKVLSHNLSDAYPKIKELLTRAVRKRLMSDRPLGCLLSGGLDSSLVTSIVWRSLKEQEREKFHCFSIGLEGGVDIEAAKKVAQHLGIKNHHIVNFSVEDGINVVERVIYSLESYDVTTIRASVPQWLLAHYVSTQTGIRVLLSGEGADELFAGYQYFKKCPDANSLKSESRRLLDELYLFDNLRTDRTTAAHGLEVRVPFLDLELVEFIDSLPAEYRSCDSSTLMEKMLLRSSFDDGVTLPLDILYRRKEAFSDAVSSHETSWYESLVHHIESELLGSGLSSEEKVNKTKELLEGAEEEYVHNPPKTLEALYYRRIFETVHKSRANLITHYWMPKWVQLDKWDPSATKLDCHQGDLSKDE